MNNNIYIGKKLIIKWEDILDGGKMIKEREIVFLIISHTKIPKNFIPLINDEDFYEKERHTINKTDKIDYENMLILKRIDGFHIDENICQELVFFKINDLEKYQYKII